MSAIKFGTSGFRGIIGDNWTKENIQKIGAAFSNIVCGGKEKVNVIIGYDNRFLGVQSAEWFCSAGANNNIHFTFMQTPVPTPYIAFKCANGFDYGIMITASHNPYFYNGIKIIQKGGRDSDDDFCRALEKEILNVGNTAGGTPPAIKFENDITDYVDAVYKMINAPKIKQSKIRVMFNPMHGSSTEILKKLFDKIGLDYTIINENRDAYFGDSMPSPYPHLLTNMAERVKNEKYNFGFALDGDGDRVTFIDADGATYDCNFLSAVLYNFFITVKKRKGGFIKSFLTSNLGARLCKKHGFELHETPVGFKYLGAVLQKQKNTFMAAEPGGMAFKDVSLLKDGMSTAMMIIDVIAHTGKGISELVKSAAKDVGFPSSYIEFAYQYDAEMRENLVKSILSSMPEFEQKVVKIDKYPDGYKIHFANDYWCAVRLSGTENVVRIPTEMPTKKDCFELIEKLEQFYNLTTRQQ
jgi:phosphomannomutase